MSQHTIFARVQENLDRATSLALALTNLEYDLFGARPQSPQAGSNVPTPAVAAEGPMCVNLMMELTFLNLNEAIEKMNYIRDNVSNTQPIEFTTGGPAPGSGAARAAR